MKSLIEVKTMMGFIHGDVTGFDEKGLPIISEEVKDHSLEEGFKFYALPANVFPKEDLEFRVFVYSEGDTNYLAVHGTYPDPEAIQITE